MAGLEELEYSKDGDRHLQQFVEEKKKQQIIYDVTGNLIAEIKGMLEEQKGKKGKRFSVELSLHGTRRALYRCTKSIGW